MNRSYGHYGHSYGEAQSAALSQGVRVVAPDDDEAASSTAAAVGRSALVGAGITSVASVAQGAAGSGTSGQALSKGIATTAKIGSAAAAVPGMLATAGITASIPVAGWIAAGGIAVAAGVIALVVHLRKGRLTKAQAKALEAKYGLDDDDLPGFTIRVMRMSSSKREKEGAKLKRALKRKKKGNLLALGRSKKRLQQKLAIIGTVIAFDQAEARGQTAKASAAKAAESPVIADASVADQASASLSALGIPTAYQLPLGLGLVALVLFFAFRRRGAS